MPYLIDGHNLIPHVTGISLGDIDDELELVQRLVQFANQQRTRLEVYFDQGIPGQKLTENYGRVRVFFVPGGRTADQAIQVRLKELGKGAKNWTVVSSDREVLSEARGFRAVTLSSAEFAKFLNSSQMEQSPEMEKKPDPSAEEIQYWLDLFSGD